LKDPYIGGDILDQASEALRQGRTLESLASQLRCSPEHLARLLGLPINPAANMVLDDPDYLWRADEMKEVL
jgi:hypothetical protein